NGQELHRNRASRKLVGTQIPAELYIKVADSLVLIRSTVLVTDPENGVDLRYGVRAIVQVDWCGQAEIVGWSATYGHGLINAVKQQDERIVGHSASLFFGQRSAVG